MGAGTWEERTPAAAGACVVQKEEWGVMSEHKPCPAARSSAMAHRLSQHKCLSLCLAEAAETLLLKADRWGAACTEAGMEENGLGMMW